MHYSTVIQLTALLLFRVTLSRPGAFEAQSINSESAAASSRSLHNHHQDIDNTCGPQPTDKVQLCNPKSPGGGPCCSEFNYCGHGPEYCGRGCQDEFGECTPKRANRQKHCGKQHKNKKCSSGDCCSSNGFCGNTKSFCGKHCQSDFGHCPVSEDDNSSANLQPLSMQAHNKPQQSISFTPFSAAVSQRCGKDYNDGICPFPQCCSVNGYCGLGSGFCTVPDYCQRAFGQCDSSVIPSGRNTSAENRDQRGDLPFGRLIKQCTKPRTMALTFDDGPHEYTANVLDTLKLYNASATFFVNAVTNDKGLIDVTPQWSKLIKRMIVEGHQVGSHTWSHIHMDGAPSYIRKDEMWKNERAIANIIGKIPTYIRPPYLECSDKTGCLKDMSDLGYHVIGYEIDTADWNTTSSYLSMQDMLKTAFDSKNEDDNMLVIQHDHSVWSATLTSFMLQEAYKKGWKATTLSECLGDSDLNSYRAARTTSLKNIPADGCVVSGPNFCGIIKPFSNKTACLESDKSCLLEAVTCEQWTGSQFVACKEFKNVCKQLDEYCESCDEFQCSSDDWEFDRWLDADG